MLYLHSANIQDRRGQLGWPPFPPPAAGALSLSIDFGSRAARRLSLFTKATQPALSEGIGAMERCGYDCGLESPMKGLLLLETSQNCPHSSYVSSCMYGVEIFAILSREVCWSH